MRRLKLFAKPVDWSLLFLYLLLIALGIFMIAPLIFIALNAFKPLDELYAFPPRFFVHRPTMQNFQDLLIATYGSWVPFSRYIFNSVLVTGLSVLGTVVVGSMAAYALSRTNMPGKSWMFTVVIAALMFSPEVTQIPRYLVVNKLGLMDTYGALIIPNLAMPLGLFLMKQFMDQLPHSLIEAARVDGASEWTIYRKIIMPLLQPAVATVAIQAFNRPSTRPATNWTTKAPSGTRTAAR
jgi:ABC-type glycerol-3-phosphate transport system permease component